MEKTMLASLVRIIEHPTDWYEDTRRDAEYVYRTADGKEESVSDLFISDENCKRIGVKVVLEYKYFTLGQADGYHFEPRRATLLEEWDDPHERKTRELYSAYEAKLQRIDEISF